MPATSFVGVPGHVGKGEMFKRLGSVMAQLEAMRMGRIPMTEDIAAVLQRGLLAINFEDVRLPGRCIRVTPNSIRSAETKGAQR